MKLFKIVFRKSKDTWMNGDKSWGYGMGLQLPYLTLGIGVIQMPPHGWWFSWNSTKLWWFRWHKMFFSRQTEVRIRIMWIILQLNYGREANGILPLPKRDILDEPA